MDITIDKKVEDFSAEPDKMPKERVTFMTFLNADYLNNKKHLDKDEPLTIYIYEDYSYPLDGIDKFLDTDSYSDKL